MRLAGIRELAECIKHGVHSGVKSDGVVGCGDVVIDSAGNTDRGDAAQRKVGSSSEGAVAADSDDSVNIVLLAGSDSLCHALLGLELYTTVGVESCAAETYDAVYKFGGKGNDLIVDKSAIAADNAYYLYTLLKCLISYCSYSCVHTGSIAARGENANLFNNLCFCHFFAFPLIS